MAAAALLLGVVLAAPRAERLVDEVVDSVLELVPGA